MTRHYRKIDVDEMVYANHRWNIHIDITAFRERQHLIYQQFQEAEQENNDSSDAPFILIECYSDIDNEIDEYVKKEMETKVLEKIPYKFPKELRSVSWDDDDEYETDNELDLING